MDWFPSYTECRDPSGWYSVPWWAVGALSGAGLAGLILAGVAGAWAPGVAALLAGLCLAGITFCTWWLNVRLICLGGDRSAIGAIYHLEPPNPTLDPFALGSYDTDYSFNLLLWQFIPKNALPSSFVGSQWSAGAEGQLAADWASLPPLVPNVSFPTVQSEVERILPQQTMASLGLSFVGQDIESADQPSPPLAGGTSQHFLLHCEIEGPGMRDLRTLLWVLWGVFVAAAALSAIPVIGSALAWILSILAFLAFLIGGAAITHDDASPPSTGGWGGTFNAWETADGPKGMVDLAYIYGRWVYDSFHDGWNELHPVHFMLKIGEATKGDLENGNWPDDLGDVQATYDGLYTGINDPDTPRKQSEPPNDWTTHPLLDGCDDGEGYPEPDPNVVIH